MPIEIRTAGKVETRDLQSLEVTDLLDPKVTELHAKVAIDHVHPEMTEIDLLEDLDPNSLQEDHLKIKIFPREEIDDPEDRVLRAKWERSEIRSDGRRRLVKTGLLLEMDLANESMIDDRGLDEVPRRTRSRVLVAPTGEMRRIPTLSSTLSRR